MRAEFPAALPNFRVPFAPSGAVTLQIFTDSESGSEIAKRLEMCGVIIAIKRICFITKKLKIRIPDPGPESYTFSANPI